MVSKSRVMTPKTSNAAYLQAVVLLLLPPDATVFGKPACKCELGVEAVVGCIRCRAELPVLWLHQSDLAGAHRYCDRRLLRYSSMYLSPALHESATVTTWRRRRVRRSLCAVYGDI